MLTPTAVFQVRQEAPGRLEADITDPALLAVLKSGAAVTLSVLAEDELDRPMHIWTLQWAEGGFVIGLRNSRSKAALDLSWADPQRRDRLHLKLLQTPKLRFHAVFELTAPGLAPLRSARVVVGAHHPPSLSPVEAIGRSDRALLLLGVVSDPDGFEDLRDVTLELVVGGRPWLLHFDIEIHRITVRDPETGARLPDGPFVLDDCDLDYFTNQVRVLAALRLDAVPDLGPEAVLSAEDHFLGAVRKTQRIRQVEAAPALPRLQSFYDRDGARPDGTGWIAALGVNREAFANAAVMVKRPALPQVHPKTIEDAEIRALHTRPAWIPQAALEAHFAGEPTNGPLVFDYFPVTHVMWSYSRNVAAQRAYVPNVNRAISMGGLSYVAGNYPDLPLETVAALDFDLQPQVIPSWKIAFPHGREILSPLRPGYWTILEGHLRKFVAEGVSSVQMDDYPNAGVCVTYGGDFSPESLAGFAAWLRASVPLAERQSAGLPDDLDGFDYRDWLHREKEIADAAHYMRMRERLPTTALFRRYQWTVALEAWRRVRALLDRLSPERHITLTSNGAPDWPAPEAYAYVSSIVDAMCAEIHTYPQRPRPDVAAITAYCMTDGLGTRVAAVPKGEENTLTAAKPFNDKRLIHIAESYAFGHQLMVPWGNWRKDVKRLYARWEREFAIQFPLDRDLSFSTEAPENVGDIFHFIRERADWLDGYRRYANVALVLRYRSLTLKTRHLIRRLLGEHVQFTCVFADDSLHPRALTPGTAACFDRLLPVDPLSDYTPDSGVQGTHAVPEPGAAIPALPRPVWCSDPEVYVTLMQKRENGRRYCVLHLLNRHYDPDGEGRAVAAGRLVLRLSAAVAGPGAQVQHCSFRDLSQMRCTEAEGEYVIHLDRVQYWTMVRFDSPE